jgi:hypothetical protein
MPPALRPEMPGRYLRARLLAQRPSRSLSLTLPLGGNVVELRSASAKWHPFPRRRVSQKPSPEGEGWVRGNHKPLICMIAPILTFPRRGKVQGFYDTLRRGRNPPRSVHRQPRIAVWRGYQRAKRSPTWQRDSLMNRTRRFAPYDNRPKPWGGTPSCRTAADRHPAECAMSDARGACMQAPPYFDGEEPLKR